MYSVKKQQHEWQQVGPAFVAYREKSNTILDKNLH